MEEIKAPFYDPLPIYSRSNAEYNLRIDTEEDIEDIVTVLDYYKNDVNQEDSDCILKKIKRFLCGCCCRPEKVKMY